ncbi:MAG: TIGR04376 family protein [Oscillatoriales cyanobacterium SM2_1_8]|nr:TIGR04376 family protein [Oscillatoriales cyanobacterium SM2_1_8]
MGLFDEIGHFLETQLEDYIRANPQLELWALEDRLQEQEAEVGRLIGELQSREKKFQDQILLAEDVKMWHGRVQATAAAGRADLETAAREREAGLLKEGNIVWAQMDLVKKRLAQALEMQAQVKARRQEVLTKIAAQAQSKQNPQTNPFQGFAPQGSKATAGKGGDDLERRFQQWEMDEEVARLKRQMGR